MLKSNQTALEHRYNSSNEINNRPNSKAFHLSFLNSLSSQLPFYRRFQKYLPPILPIFR